jgi:hypothetical protein
MFMWMCHGVAVGGGKEECPPLVVTQLPNALAPTTAALTAHLFYFPDVTRHGMMCLGVAVYRRDNCAHTGVPANSR